MARILDADKESGLVAQLMGCVMGGSTASAPSSAGMGVHMGVAGVRGGGGLTGNNASSERSGTHSKQDGQSRVPGLNSISYPPQGKHAPH